MWGKGQQTQANKAAGAAAPSPAAAQAAPVSAPAPETGTVPDGIAQSSGPGAELERAPAAATPENGAAVQAPSAAAGGKAQAFRRGKLATANFGGAISLFMRSPAHRHYTLADLEWALVPPLALNQFMMAEAKLQDGQAVPVALVLWARVSAEVDARLSAAPRYPIRLHPNEWQNGDVFWIVDAVGEGKAVQQCIEAITKTAFQGKGFKMLQLQSSRQTN
ncbi:MAG: toxin-activating lysine-acyltransferase [Rhodomicrobium sp.]